MKTTQIPKIEGYRDGTIGLGWWLDPSGVVLIRCPDNEHVGNLAAHTIAADGKVTPSILVTNESDGYGWHVMGQLVGWAP